MLNTAVERTLVVVTALLMCAGASPAADLHPIVEVESGYLFGAISDGKWIKADETAKLIGDETTYRVYGLTQTVGDAKGDKPKPEDVPCEETLAVALSPQPEHGMIAIAAPWNALPRKPQVTDPTQKTYVDAVREFLRTKEIDQPKVKIDNIVRVDLDGDGEEEVLISATNYFRKDDSVPMRSSYWGNIPSRKWRPAVPGVVARQSRLRLTRITKHPLRAPSKMTNGATAWRRIGSRLTSGCCWQRGKAMRLLRST